MSEIQETYRILTEINKLLADIELKISKIEGNTRKIEKTTDDFRNLERLALRYLTISRRMGLPDQIEQATQLITTLVVMMRMLQISATMISGGGIGALIGIAGVISVTMQANDMLGYDTNRGYSY